MPVQQCQRDGKKGFRWGASGTCYIGTRAHAKAERQGKAIKASGRTHNAACGCVHNASTKRRGSPLRADPTRSKLLRLKFERDFRTRLEALKGKIRRLVIDADAFGLKQTRNEGRDNGHSEGTTGIQTQIQRNASGQNSGRGNRRPNAGACADRQVAGNNKEMGLLANARQWEAKTDANKVKAFTAWLEEQIQAGIITVTAAKSTEGYWKAYVEEAYRKGQGRAFEQVRGPILKGTKGEKFARGSKAEFLTASFGRPVAVEKVKFLAGRVFTDLKGVTSAMETQIIRVLTDGLAAGDGPATIARNMNDRISKIGQHRATLIARTEITRAHAEGQLDAFDRLGVKEVGVMAEWSTAGDDRVCPLCQPLEGVVMTLREARGLIPRHVSCRCIMTPSNVGEPANDTTRVNFTNPRTGEVEAKDVPQKRGKAKVSAARDKSVRAEIPKSSKRTLAEQKDLSTWKGADATITKRRPKRRVGKPT